MIYINFSSMAVTKLAQISPASLHSKASSGASNDGRPMICNGFIMIPDVPQIESESTTVKIKLVNSHDNRIVEINRSIEVSEILNNLLAYYINIDESQKPVLICESLRTELCPNLLVSSYNIPDDEILQYRLISNSEIEQAIEDKASTNANSPTKEESHLYQCPSEVPWVTQRLYDARQNNIVAPSREFVSSLENGKIYLGSVVINEKRDILSYKKMLPLVEILEDTIQNVEESYNNNIGYVSSVVNNWNNLIRDGALSSATLATDMLNRYREFKIIDQLGSAGIAALDTGSLKFRQGFYAACLSVYSRLDLQDLGALYPYPVFVNHDTLLILLLHQCTKKDVNTDFLKQFKLSFIKRKDLISQYFSTTVSERLNTIFSDESIVKRTNYSLKPGLYLGIFQTATTMRDTRILVQSQIPSLIPLCTIRTQSKLSTVENKLIESMIKGTDEEFVKKNPTAVRFRQELKAAFEHLNGITHLEVSMAKFYSSTPIEWGNDISIIMLNTPISQLVDSNHSQNAKNFEYIDIKQFEILHFGKYSPSQFNRHSYGLWKLGPLLIQASALELLTTIDSTLSIERERAKRRLEYLERQITILQKSWISARWTRMMMTENMSKTTELAFKPISTRLKELGDQGKPYNNSAFDVSKE